MTEILMEMTGILMEMTEILMEMTGILMEMTGILMDMTGILMEMTGILMEFAGILMDMTGILRKREDPSTIITTKEDPFIMTSYKGGLDTRVKMKEDTGLLDTIAIMWKDTLEATAKT